jgi:CheY-like chemotaxis protein
MYSDMAKNGLRVMVVEDEELLLRAIAKKLELSGNQVISCTSGKQAVDYLENMQEKPDVVWLDFYLRDMTGLDFMNALKHKQGWGNIPVIVVSNSASPDKVSKMMALGARKYVLKAETRLDELVDMVNEIVDTKGEPKT